MDNLVYYLVGVLVLIIIAKILLLPLKKIMSLILNAVIGGFSLVLFNYVGKFAGLNIAITPINSILVGVLGVPGVVILLLFQMEGGRLATSILDRLALAVNFFRA